MITDTEVMHILARMTEETRALFDMLPENLQVRYIEFWSKRPDTHAAHRDTLPAFIWGLLSR